MKPKPTGASVLDRLDLRLGERVSELHFQEDLLPAQKALQTDVAQGRKPALISDVNVWKALPESEKSWLSAYPRYLLPSGESTKSLKHLGAILDFLASHQLDRQSIVVALGGGVVGDLAGFAAAVYLRGVTCYQIPTSLLAMVDSSVGGKTGINLSAGKNLVGAFHQPEAVFIATNLLKTLPPREFHAGVAEILKYGLLGDLTLWEELHCTPLDSPEDPRIRKIIAHCCAMKAAIVEADEKETSPEGGRALLNLGHTFGHAIENVSGYGEYLHGEAIAIGLVAAGVYSSKQYEWDLSKVEQIRKTILAHGLPVRLHTPLQFDALLHAMRSDKKNRQGHIRLVLMETPGKAVTFNTATEPAILEAWKAVFPLAPST